MTTKRRYTRKPLEVDFSGKEGEASGHLLFGAKDVSPGGAFLKADLLFEEGEVLSLEFQLPGRPGALRTTARVVRVNRFPAEGEDAGMGVQFVGLSPEDLAALEAFVDG